mmetsp:Transcript_110964/g.310062  ORF Transcript_110964/g.310062 Transcript_110964/m.310062 type:complete len:208 (+) Transcript_110964:148-771(+)
MLPWKFGGTPPQGSPVVGMWQRVMSKHRKVPMRALTCDNSGAPMDFGSQRNSALAKMCGSTKRGNSNCINSSRASMTSCLPSVEDTALWWLVLVFANTPICLPASSSTGKDVIMVSKLLKPSAALGANIKFPLFRCIAANAASSSLASKLLNKTRNCAVVTANLCTTSRKHFRRLWCEHREISKTLSKRAMTDSGKGSLGRLKGGAA